MKHEELEQALGLYALGVLEPDLSGELERHLAAGCPGCHALLRQYEAATDRLPYTLPNRALPKDLKTNVMAVIEGKPAAPPNLTPPVNPPSTWRPLSMPDPVTSPPFSPLVSPPSPHTAGTTNLALSSSRPGLSPFTTSLRKFVSLSLILALSLVLLGVVAYAVALRADRDAKRVALDRSQQALARAESQEAELKRRLSDLQRQVASVQADLNRAVEALGITYDLLAERDKQLETLQKARLRAEPSQRTQSPTADSPAGATEDPLARLVASPSAIVIAMTGRDISNRASAVAILEPETRSGLFYGNNLPPLPAGKSYQLWVVGEKPVSAGVFALDAELKGRMILRDLPDIAGIKQAFVSLEPKDGAPQPGGDIYLSGAR